MNGAIMNRHWQGYWWTCEVSVPSIHVLLSQTPTFHIFNHYSLPFFSCSQWKGHIYSAFFSSFGNSSVFLKCLLLFLSFPVINLWFYLHLSQYFCFYFCWSFGCIGLAVASAVCCPDLGFVVFICLYVCAYVFVLLCSFFEIHI